MIKQKGLPKLIGLCISYSQIDAVDINGNVWTSKILNFNSGNDGNFRFEMIEGLQDIKEIAHQRSLHCSREIAFKQIVYILTLNNEGTIFTVNETDIVEVKGLPPIQAFSADKIVAALDEEGAIWTWKEAHDEPRRIGLRGPPAIAILVQRDYIKYVDMEGKLWKYPRSNEELYACQLFTNQNLPPFKELIGCSGHGFAYTDNYELWGWGENREGQIHVEKRSFSPFPQPIPTEHQWISISCTPGETLLINCEGKLFSWNSQGETHIHQIERAYTPKSNAKSARK